MIKEIHESNGFEMGSDVYSDIWCNDGSVECVSPQRMVEHAWRDIVDYCRSFNEGQTADNG